MLEYECIEAGRGGISMVTWSMPRAGDKGKDGTVKYVQSGKGNHRTPAFSPTII